MGESAQPLQGMTDLAMPEMGGRALISELRGRRSRLPILVMTGYGDDELLAPGELDVTARIQKPFDLTLLARHVRDALDGVRVED